MVITLVVVPSKRVSPQRLLDEICARVDLRTWDISTRGRVWTHNQYDGKARIYKGGYIIISAEDEDSEALTLGAFINLLHRKAKEEIKVITIVF